MTYSGINHWVEAHYCLSPFQRHFAFLLTPVFVNSRRNVVFLESTTSQMHVNISVTVKTVGGFSLCNGGKLEESE